MKKAIVIIILLSACSYVFPQGNLELRKRLNELAVATEAMDFKKVLDYTYPKVFTIVPKKTMLEVLEKSILSDEFNIKFDSLKVDSLYPIFKMPAGSFAKINCSVKMIMNVKYPADVKTPEAKKEYFETILTAMKAQFGTQKVNTDTIGNIGLNINSPMVAIKDPRFPNLWYFVNFKETDPLMGRLFTKQLIDKLASYK